MIYIYDYFSCNSSQSEREANKEKLMLMKSLSERWKFRFEK